MTIKGPLVYAKYGWEANYGVESGAQNKVFGLGVEVERRFVNNMTRLRSIGDKNAEAAASGRAEGTLTVTATMSNPWWLKMFYGVAADAGVGPFTHTWTEANEPETFTTDLGYALTRGGAANDMNIACIGCIAKSASIEATQGEPVKLSLNISYIDEAQDLVLGVKASDTGYGAPFIFAHGIVSIAGAPLAIVEGVTFELNQNVEHVYGLSTRRGQTFVAGPREYNFTIRTSVEDASHIVMMYGQAASPLFTDNVGTAGAVTLTFNNGLAGVAQRQLILTLANLYVDEDGHSLRPEDLVNDELVGFALSLTNSVATDNTAVAL